MSKTPFEIRFELLKMAQEHLIAQYKTNLEFFQQYQTETLKGSVATLNEIQKAVPQMPSIEQIMEKATELYGFVTKK